MRLIGMLLILVCVVNILKAQDGYNSIYFLPNLPQRVRINPAYQPEYKTWVGLPGLSGISVNYLNSSFALKDLLRKDGQDSLYVDIDRMYKSLRKRNIIGFTNENSLLTVGFRIKSWYATVDITQKNDLVFRTNKELFSFLKNGNAPYLGKNMDLGRLGLRLSAYDEFAFGLSKKVNEKLTVGGRAKFLLGIANADMRKSKIQIGSSDDAELIQLHSQQDLRISAPVTLSYSKDGDYVEWDDLDADVDDFSAKWVLNTKNPGFALDLGAEYQYNDKLKLYASLVDLGFIHWGAKNYRFTQDVTFDWKGADLSNSVNSNDSLYRDLDDAFDDLVDSLKDNFRMKDGEGSYTTMLRGKLFLGATYRLNKMVEVGGLAELTLMDKAFYPSLTVSADVRLCRNVSAAVAYSLMPGNYVNLGAALTAKLGPVQLYASTDNVLGADYTSTQSLNARLGINLLFGHKDKKKKEKKAPVVEIAVVPVVPVQKTAEVKKDTVHTDTVVPEQIIEEELVISPFQEEVIVEQERESDFVYHVIMGSFKERKRAENLKKRLLQMHFDEAQILLTDHQMFRVSALTADTYEEARQEIKVIQKKYPAYDDLWVLRESER